MNYSREHPLCVQNGKGQKSAVLQRFEPTEDAGVKLTGSSTSTLLQILRFNENLFLFITWQDWSSETWSRHGSHARWRSSTTTRNWQDVVLLKQSARVTGTSVSASVSATLITPSLCTGGSLATGTDASNLSRNRFQFVYNKPVCLQQTRNINCSLAMQLNDKKFHGQPVPSKFTLVDNQTAHRL